MRKGGIIAAIVIIIISVAIFFGVGSITDRLPQPKFGDIYGFIFNPIESNKNQTVIIARLNITNSNKNDINITIIYENLKCEVFYFDQFIGILSLNTTQDDLEKDMDQILYSSNEVDFEDKKSFFKKITWPKEKIISSIKGGRSQNYFIIFNISNDALSRVVYNHTMENNEYGKITFNLSFKIELNLPFNLTIPIHKEIIIPIEKDFKTNLLEIFNGIKYNINISENLSNYAIRNITRISIFKGIESNIIQFNYTTRFLRRIIPLFDLYLGDDSYWIKNTDPLDVRIGQELTIYSKPLRIFIINRCLFPAEIIIYVNDIQIGQCHLQLVERGFYLKNSQIIEATTLIDMSKFGEWIYSHIKNNETSLVNISIQLEKNFITRLLGLSEEVFIEKKIDEKFLGKIPNIELPKTSLDYSKIKNRISLYQNLILVVIINTIIVVIILYFSFWKKEKYLIFK